MRRLALVFAVVCLLVVGAAPVALADPTPAELQQKVEELQGQVSRLQLQLQQQQEIKQEIKQELQEYRNFVEQERRESKEFLQWLITSVGVGIGAIAVVAGFFGWKTWRNILDGSLAEFRAKTEKEWEAAAKHAVGDLEAEQNRLRRLLDRERMYQKAQVLALGRREDLDAMKAELELFRDKEIHVVPRPLEDTDVRKWLEDHQVDIVIYRYRPEPKQDPFYRATMSVIADVRGDVPILVYTPGVNVEGDDKDEVRKYKWATYAQNGATLASHLYNLTHLFQGRKGH